MIYDKVLLTRLGRSTPFSDVPDDSTAELVKNHNRNLVGQRTNAEILSSLRDAIVKLNGSRYTEPGSGVSSTLLLTYCWAAANDPSQWREGVTQGSAKACFYEALYEIDREYALSSGGRDEGTSGSTQTCAGGSFNKMIEGMSKIHKCCEVNYITPATAALKLPCVVRQVLKQHLTQNPSDLQTLKNEGLSALWPDLKSEVKTVMQHDFSAIYPSTNGQDHPGLLAMVDAGEYTDLTQSLPVWEQQLSLLGVDRLEIACG